MNLYIKSIHMAQTKQFINLHINQQEQLSIISLAIDHGISESQ